MQTKALSYWERTEYSAVRGDMLTSIGEFEVKDEIGHGGMGRVYRAHDPRMGRDVAIKIITNEEDGDLLARFRSEAGTTGKLAHKNIVTIYLFGDQDGMPYIVMELLPGEDLGRIIRERRPLTLLEKVHILHQVSEGLCYAHQRAVIHRDIKPGNVMVLPDGTAKILDFGIARVTGTNSTRRTQKGFFLGTIAYMAPEQFKLGMDADQLVDIFAFGGVAYQLITGEYPFGEGDPGTLISRITSADPKPIRELAPECPELLAFIIHQSLQKDRDLRYQSLKDVLLDLEPVLYQLRHDRAAQILLEAHPLVEQGEFEQALAKVKESMELDPMNREADRIKRQLQQELHRKAVRGKVEALIAEADKQAAQRNFADAIQALESALQLDKTESIAARLEDVRRKRERAKRAAQLLVEARAEERQGKLGAAYAKVSEALEVDPNNTTVSQSMDRLREVMEQRRRRLREALESASACTAKRDFERALVILDKVAQEQGESPEVAAERDRLREARDVFQQRRNSCDEAVLAVRAGISAGNLEQARAAIDQISKSYGDLPGAAERIKELEEELGRRREAEVGRVARDVDELVRQAQFEAAQVKLDAALARYPDAAELQAALGKLVHTKAARERAAGIARATANIGKLRRDGELEAALQAAKAAAGEYPDHAPFQNLAAQIEAELQEMRRRAKIDETARQALPLLESDPFQAGELLQRTLAEVGSEAYLESLLAAAQRAAARRREQEAVDRILASAKELRAAQRGLDALKELDRALEQYPQRSELRLAASEIRAELERAERAEKLRAATEKIKRSLAEGSLADCRALIDEARKAFPGYPGIEQLGVDLARALREQELAALAASVRQSLLRDDLAGAERLLAACAQRFAGQPQFQALKTEIDQRQAGLRALETARQLAGQSKFSEAEAMLAPYVNAGHQRAIQLREAISKQHARADEEARQRERKERKEQERKEARARQSGSKKLEAPILPVVSPPPPDQRETASLDLGQTVALDPAAISPTGPIDLAPAPPAAAPAKAVEPPGSIIYPVAVATPTYRRPAVLALAAIVVVVLVYFIVRPGKLPPLQPSPLKVSLQYQAGSRQTPFVDVDFGDVAAKFSVTSAVSWLGVVPSSGDHLTKLHVTVPPNALAPKGYDSEIRLVTADGRRAIVPVHLEVVPDITISVPPRIQFPDYRADGRAQPGPMTIPLTDEQLKSVHASWQDQNDSRGFTFETVRGGLRISVQTRGMQLGKHTAILVLDFQGVQKLVTVSIDIRPSFT